MSAIQVELGWLSVELDIRFLGLICFCKNICILKHLHTSYIAQFVYCVSYALICGSARYMSTTDVRSSQITKKVTRSFYPLKVRGDC